MTWKTWLPPLGVLAAIILLIAWASGAFVPASRRAVCTSPQGEYFAIEGYRVENDYGAVVAKDDAGRVTRRLITGVHDTCSFYRDRLEERP